MTIDERIAAARERARLAEAARIIAENAALARMNADLADVRRAARDAAAEAAALEAGWGRG